MERVDLTFSPSTSCYPDISPEKLLDKSYGLVAEYNNIPPYYDEPRFYHILAKLPAALEIEKNDIKKLEDDESESLVTAGGCSLDKKRALWKVVGEAAEREALIYRETLPIKYCTFYELNGKGINPNSIPAGTSNDYPDRRVMPMGWVLGFTLPLEEPVWIPAQLVFVPYVFREGEAVIREPMSTGAACARSISDALYIAISEVVERDAFMVGWLCQLRLKRIMEKEIPVGPYSFLLRKTLGKLKRYHLRPEFYILPTDVNLHVIMCALWDETDIGPTLSIGARASWALDGAMLGAVEEAQQLRPWLRFLLEEKPDLKKIKSVPSSMRLVDRARFWLSGFAVEKFRNWLDSQEISDLPKKNTASTLGELIDSIKKVGVNCYAIDLTAPNVKKLKLAVVKSIIPEFQPLYLDEELRDIAWNRLRNYGKYPSIHSSRSVLEVENFPHPFL